MTKRSRFSAGLKNLGGTDAPVTERPRAAHVNRADDTAPESAGGKYLAPSRRGKKAIVGHYDPAVSRQLAFLALEQERSQNELIAEALNLLFERHGKPPIATG